MYSKIRIDDYKEFLRMNLHKDYTMLVADEVHACANSSSKQHQALDELLNLCYRYVLLTGTEFTHDPATYHATYKLATRTSVPLEDWVSYFNRGLVDKVTGKPRWDEDRLKSIRNIRGTYGLRRIKSDIADLPKQTGPITLIIPMTHEHRKAYIELWNNSKYEFMNELNELSEVTIEHFFAKFIRLYQMATLPLLLQCPINPTYKLEALIRLLEECGDQKVIIWSNFPKCIEWIAEQINKQLPYKKVGYAHGGVSQQHREKCVKDFEENKILDIVIANPAIWSQGVTLNEASIMIYWDLHPSRSRWKQSQDRNYRIGQTKAVTIYCLIHESSIEGMTFNWLGQKDYWSDLVVEGKSKAKPKVRVHGKWKINE
jgi:hypothetical protein